MDGHKDFLYYVLLEFAIYRKNAKSIGRHSRKEYCPPFGNFTRVFNFLQVGNDIMYSTLSYAGLATLQAPRSTPARASKIISCALDHLHPSAKGERGREGRVFLKSS